MTWPGSTGSSGRAGARTQGAGSPGSYPPTVTLLKLWPPLWDIHAPFLRAHPSDLPAPPHLSPSLVSTVDEVSETHIT